MHVMKSCNFSHIGPLSMHNFDELSANVARDDALCDHYLNLANDEMGNIDIYDIYVDVCLKQSEAKIIQQYAKAGSRVHKAMVKKIYPPYKPCEDEYTSLYLNRADVQRAIHANIPYAWHDCSSRVNYAYSDVEKSVLPLYQDFFKNTNLRILIYSGDVDAIVPYSGTREWVYKLNRPIVDPWKPYYIGKQVGGYFTVYKGLTFATVRGAGHMVPGTQPQRGFEMFRHFLHGSV